MSSAKKASLPGFVWPIAAGLCIGIAAPVLVKYGNPGNMGVCVACFTRDIAGALGLHRAAVVQYIRPELIGIVLGAFLAALAGREFRPRGGSSGVVKFVLGMIAMIGALVFLGCPWRAFLRIGGGDVNALVGLLGFIAGVAASVPFQRFGFSLGRSVPLPRAVGVIVPFIALVLLALLILNPQFGRVPAQPTLTSVLTGTAPSVVPAGPIFMSKEGPGSKHAPLIIALAAGLIIGVLVQRSRFCSVGAVRNLIIAKNADLALGVLALIVSAVLANIALGQFKFGITGQPIAHTDGLWNFAGMALAGLAVALAGGCPGRQCVLAAEGDSDAATFVLGMLVGAALAHNFTIASTPAGPGVYAPAAVIAGLVICVIIGIIMREPKTA